uniref:Uncharacterized protein MANES_01G088000 n=1 Tax=Rhizophora mucronata TaxID=61149 RepID=A0A2P2LYS2_RHIMU
MKMATPSYTSLYPQIHSRQQSCWSMWSTWMRRIFRISQLWTSSRIKAKHRTPIWESYCAGHQWFRIS